MADYDGESDVLWERGHAVSSVAALGPEQRARDLARLRAETFDVLVIGGGVTGAGVALDAATRGLSVALVEARDWAAGTSSRSSKLIHGGLRYLEQLDFPLVREALKERGLLVGSLAPHLVQPVPFVLPLEHRIWQRAYYGAGVALYDVLGSVFGTARGMPRHKHLSLRATLKAFPSLRRDAMIGSIRYYDGQVDDARFTLTVAKTAAQYGAALVTSARVTDLLRGQSGRVEGVRLRDLEACADDDGGGFDVRARRVIAATGVWSDDLGEMLASGATDAHPPVSVGLRVRASKGVHLLVAREKIKGDVGLILRTEKSVLFVIPWGEHWIIGTTDTEWDLDRAHPAASSSDIDYILDHVNRVLERPLRRDDIEGVYAGLRPLLAGESDATSKLSREHAVVSPLPGLALIAGGKYTTYRVMAADAVDVATEDLGWVSGSRTDRIPLVGARGYPNAWKQRIVTARRHGLTVPTVEHLLHRYGDAAYELLSLVDSEPVLVKPLTAAPEYLAVEVYYAAANEGALHLDDILTRRTRISVETVHRGVDCAEEVADIVAPVLGWDEPTRKREIDHYRARVDAERESQTQPDDRTADAARLGAPDVRGTAMAG